MPEPKAPKWIRCVGYTELTIEWRGRDGAKPLSIREDQIAMVEPVEGHNAFRIWLVNGGPSVIIFPDAPDTARIRASHFPTLPRQRGD